MNTTKDECLQCGSTATLRYPDGILKCLECGREAPPPHASWNRSAPVPASPPTQPPAPTVTVGRYCKPDGFKTRHFAVHLDGNLLVVTVFRKGAQAVKETLDAVLNGRVPSPASTVTNK